MYFQINCKREREREQRQKKERSMCNLKMLRQKWDATHNNRLPQLRLCCLCHRAWTQSQQSLEQWKLQSRLCFLNAAVGFNHLGIYYWGCHPPSLASKPCERQSIADIKPLINQTNNIESYRFVEIDNGDSFFIVFHSDHTEPLHLGDDPPQKACHLTVSKIPV